MLLCKPLRFGGYFHRKLTNIKWEVKQKSYTFQIRFCSLTHFSAIWKAKSKPRVLKSNSVFQGLITNLGMRQATELVWKGGKSSSPLSGTARLPSFQLAKHSLRPSVPVLNRPCSGHHSTVPGQWITKRKPAQRLSATFGFLSQEFYSSDDHHCGKEL